MCVCVCRRTFIDKDAIILYFYVKVYDNINFIPNKYFKFEGFYGYKMPTQKHLLGKFTCNLDRYSLKSVL